VLESFARSEITEMQFTGIVIKKWRRCLSEYVSGEVLSSFPVDIEKLFDGFGQRLTAMIDLPYEPLKEVSSIARCEVPLTWFDHLRGSVCPRFLSRYCPIRFKTIEIPVRIEVGAVYPKLPKFFPPQSESMRFVSRPTLDKIYNENQAPAD